MAPAAKIPPQPALLSRSSIVQGFGHNGQNLMNKYVNFAHQFFMYSKRIRTSDYLFHKGRVMRHE